MMAEQQTGPVLPIVIVAALMVPGSVMLVTQMAAWYRREQNGGELLLKLARPALAGWLV